MTRIPLKLYMDHHVPRAITTGLRLRHIDVITAYEDRTHEIADSDLLDRATSLGRVLFTQDDDLLAEATQRQQAGVAFVASTSSASIPHLPPCIGARPPTYLLRSGARLAFNELTAAPPSKRVGAPFLKGLAA